MYKRTRVSVERLCMLVNDNIALRVNAAYHDVTLATYNNVVDALRKGDRYILDASVVSIAMDTANMVRVIRVNLPNKHIQKIKATLPKLLPLVALGFSLAALAIAIISVC